MPVANVEDALNRNQVDVDSLQKFLNNSLNDNNVQAIVQALNAFDAANNNVGINDVVAVDILSNRDVVVYAQQR